MDAGFGTARPKGRASLASEWAFLGISALLFIASVGGTIYWWRTMSGGMPDISHQTYQAGLALGGKGLNSLLQSGGSWRERRGNPLKRPGGRGWGL